MIFVRLSGGLGNQMFQYAMGRALSLRNKCDLALDTTALSKPDKNGILRHYALDAFKIAAKVATAEDFKTHGISALVSQSHVGKLMRSLRIAIDSRRPIAARKLIVEPSYSFTSEITKARPSSLLVGVWQSEKYFKDYEQTVRKEFVLSRPLSSTAAALKALISASDSISLHVRRGDYAHNEKTNRKHGLCSPQYYSEAISWIISKYDNPRFFIFSDDIKWVKKHIEVPESAVFASSPQLTDFEELFLMSSCKHNIIANSSFSWWAAWLNSNPAKEVIAPKKWFSSEISDKDLIPSEWIRL